MKIRNIFRRKLTIDQILHTVPYKLELGIPEVQLGYERN
jgi:hypothetical protein